MARRICFLNFLCIYVLFIKKLVSFVKKINHHVTI